MEAQWVADRLQLRSLLATRPDWTLHDLADALGRSYGWVKKWKKRLQAAPPQDEQVLHSRSRARKHPPPALNPLVIDRLLAIRDAPPQNLKRVPGPKAIRYYLDQEAATALAGQRLPRSTRTIWRILRQHQRICDPIPRVHHPLSFLRRSAVGKSTLRMPAVFPPSQMASSSMSWKRSIRWMSARRS